MTQPIIIVRGNDTNWNGLDFLTITLTTEILNLANFTATFTANGIVKTFDNLSSGQIKVNFTASETQSMPSSFFGVLRLFDSTKRVATIESLIPFKVIDTVHGDAIATEPYTLNFDVEQGGETILTVNVEAGVSVEVGTTTTLPAGSDATVTNSGTGNHLILDFGIPKGNGIASIEKTSTVGLVDTYTVTYETGDADTFEVTNGNGIKSVAKTSASGLIDTYTITFDNNDTETFTVTNGSSIASIEKTSTSGLVDTYTVTLTNGDTSTFTVTNGTDGEDGADGFSPIATISKSGDMATITITDKNGTTTATVKDGADGTNATITGATASVSNTVGIPSVTVTSGGTESARSFNFAFTNLKGEKGDTGASMVAEVVQTLPTTGETGKIYLVPKDNPEQQDIYDEWIWAIVSSPDTYGWEHIGSTEVDLTGVVKSVNNTAPDANGNVNVVIPVTDLQINSTSILSSGVANIPIAGSGTLGVVKLNANQGVSAYSAGDLCIISASEAELIAKTSSYKPIVPNKLDIAIREGLGNNGLTWTDAYKANARNTIGASKARTTVTDTTSTSITLANAVAGTDYHYGTLTSLTVTANDTSDLETTIYFTAGGSITVSLPATIQYIGNAPIFEAGKSYVISILNNILVSGELA